jgi:dTDP-4-dehydrorhamnose 3,5-epimerase
MKIIETGFNGLLEIIPAIYADKRGYFFESFNGNAFRDAGISFFPLQDNESKSSKGVIRGLHYQLKPSDQSKLVRVIEGKILDVALDIRQASPTFGKWYGVELDSETKNQLLIPRGFAHGFSVLSEVAIIQYKCDNIYNPLYERGIAFNDPELNINWKIREPDRIISDKDMKHPLLKDAENNF